MTGTGSARQPRFYRPELDALRFFAFCCVLLHHLPIEYRHSGPVRLAAAFGVNLFFVLSAYLLLTLLVQERAARGKVAWGAFAARRMLRIWPLYFLVIGIGWMVGHFGPEVHVTAKLFTYLLLLSGNIYIMRFGWQIPPTQSMLWSISVEEQFYLALPLLARASRRVMTAVCLLAIVFAYVKLAMFQSRGLQWLQVWTNSFVQLQFFATGALIALWTPGRSMDRRAATRVCLFGMGVALWLCAYRCSLVGKFAVDLLGTAAIFYAVLGIQSHVPVFLRYLGRISYGLYMFHVFWVWAVFERPGAWFVAHQIAGSVLVLAGTILTASVSYEVMEKPILKYKRRFEIVKTRV